MSFNSAGFGVFLAVVLALYYLFQRLRHGRVLQNGMLLGASYWFYGSWDHRFLFLILCSTAIDYVCGLAIQGKHLSRGKASLLLGAVLGSGLALLAPWQEAVLRTELLPKQAFQGGWAEAQTGALLSLVGEDWLLVGSAFLAVLVAAAALAAGRRLRQSGQRRYYLVLSLIANLGLLGFFKYWDFFLSSLEELVSGLGLPFSGGLLGIAVPVGISFYTFQTLSYTIDIYRGKLTATRNLLDFALFVAYFPQLVAGPIERAAALLPQMQRVRRLDWTQMQIGVHLIGWGLFKKIFVADNLAPIVENTFSSEAAVSGPAVLVATYAFAFQIYCDFSGYSDIARGAARLMGIDLRVNFNIPYRSTNPREFWRRWHISLSEWLRDYLYKNLGGNRGSRSTLYRNLLVTMVLGGLWHGARANFVLWGLFHGVLLCVHRHLEPTMKAILPRQGAAHLLVRFLCWLGFFHLTCYGWLLFRADSLAQIGSLTGALFTVGAPANSILPVLLRVLWYCSPVILVQCFQGRSANLLAPLTWPWPVRSALYTALFYLTILFGELDVREFIYFQF